MGNNDGWAEWSKHVLLELERLNNCYEGLRKEVSRLSVEVGMLNVKAGIWGVAGGLLAVFITILLKWRG